MISTSRIDPFSSRVLSGGKSTSFVVSNLADSGRPSEFHIFYDAPGRPSRCVNASPYRTEAEALRAFSCLTPF